MSWYNSNWQKRIKINTKNAQVSAAYPWAMIYDTSAHLTGSEYNDFWASIKSDGGDIRMTKADGETEVPRGVREFDTAEKEGLIYFKAEDISTSADTDFYIYFDNESASDYANDNANGMENVFSSDYKFYSTMADLTTSSIKDETSNDNDGTKGAANQPLETNGKIGKAQDFSGGDYKIDLPALGLGTNGARSIVLFYKYDGVSENAQNIFFQGIHDSSGRSWELDTVLNGSGNRTYRIASSGGRLATAFKTFGGGGYDMVIVTYDGNGTLKDDGVHIYVNGSDEALTLAGSQQTLNITDDANAIGYRRSANDLYILGDVDEFRVLNVELSQNEATTIYNNQSNNATFFDTGEIEEVSGFNPAIARRRLLIR